MTFEQADGSDVELMIAPRASDLGNGFMVQRALPSAGRQMVGPFIFLDQMGPAVLRAGEGLDVAPHPHIGLATVTYLFDGEMLHRDSLGAVQSIRPGELNLMTAGRGIVHSERTPPDARVIEKNLFGLQAWLALPGHAEESEPAFAHHGQDELPVIEEAGVSLRLIMGSLHGERAPAALHSETVYADVRLARGARLKIAPEHEERAVYIVAGEVQVEKENTAFAAGRLLVLRRGAEVIVRANTEARLMLLGGEPMESRRFIWWNFVSSSRERIEQAKQDWREQRFGSVPDETGFIPLPERKPAPVKYP